MLRWVSVVPKCRWPVASGRHSRESHCADDTLDDCTCQMVGLAAWQGCGAGCGVLAKPIV
jgi:hypothetical protein